MRVHRTIFGVNISGLLITVVAQACWLDNNIIYFVQAKTSAAHRGVAENQLLMLQELNMNIQQKHSELYAKIGDLERELEKTSAENKRLHALNMQLQEGIFETITFFSRKQT